MLIRVIVLFLLFMLVMGMIQKAFLPKRQRRSQIDRLRCPSCKRIHFSNNPGPCGRDDCGYR